MKNIDKQLVSSFFAYSANIAGILCITGSYFEFGINEMFNFNTGLLFFCFAELMKIQKNQHATQTSSNRELIEGE